LRGLRHLASRRRAAFVASLHVIVEREREKLDRSLASWRDDGL
jgi:hypothetical protein